MMRNGCSTLARMLAFMYSMLMAVLFLRGWFPSAACPKESTCSFLRHASMFAWKLILCWFPHHSSPDGWLPMRNVLLKRWWTDGFLRCCLRILLLRKCSRFFSYWITFEVKLNFYMQFKSRDVAWGQHHEIDYNTRFWRWGEKGRLSAILLVTAKRPHKTDSICRSITLPLHRKNSGFKKSVIQKRTPEHP